MANLFDDQNLFSHDGFDLLSLGMIPEEDPAEELAETNPLTDMDSLDFYLWMQEEVDKEAERRRREKK